MRIFLSSVLILPHLLSLSLPGVALANDGTNVGVGSQVNREVQTDGSSGGLIGSTFEMFN